MQKIKISLDRFKKKPEKVLSERASLVKEFYDTLVKDWDVKYGELKARRIAVMLAPVKTKDLYAFLADCKYASHFSKYFWSRFKK